MNSSERSYKRITKEDLSRLAFIANADAEDFFQRNPKYMPISKRRLCVILCQGAALHYLDGEHGIKDFDIFTFFARTEDIQLPSRRLTRRDFGNPKFGKSIDRLAFSGRRVDLFIRGLESDIESDPIMALHKYLSEQKTSTARELSKRPVVILEPSARLGEIVWMPEG